MTTDEIKKAQEQVFSHTSAAGSLSDVASVLVKFVYHLSPDCYFNPVKTTASEWYLYPRKWIGFTFSSGRSGYRPKIVVSADVWPSNLEEEATKLKIQQGRFPQWSKFTLDNIGDIKEALHLISKVYDFSG